MLVPWQFVEGNRVSTVFATKISLSARTPCPANERKIVITVVPDLRRSTRPSAPRGWGWSPRIAESPTIAADASAERRSDGAASTAMALRAPRKAALAAVDAADRVEQDMALRSIPPIHDRVPEPLPPAAPATVAAG